MVRALEHHRLHAALSAARKHTEQRFGQSASHSAPAGQGPTCMGHGLNTLAEGRLSPSTCTSSELTLECPSP